MGDGKVAGTEGMLFGRDVVQAFGGVARAHERRPGGKKIQSQPEAGLDDGDARVSTGAPALRQAVAFEKDMARLRQSAAGAVINVVQRRAEKFALLVVIEAGRRDRDRNFQGWRHRAMITRGYLLAVI